MADKGESSDEEPTIASDVVVTKYKMAGDMANSEYEITLSLIRAHQSTFSLSLHISQRFSVR